MVRRFRARVGDVPGYVCPHPSRRRYRCHAWPAYLIAHRIWDSHPPPLLRSGATIGDSVYITGTLGDAALGLDILQARLSFADTAQLITRYYYPEPRITIGQRLHGIATSCMDISDGLLQDAAHIARASNVALLLDAAALPLSDAAQRALDATPSLLRRIVSGGDDYELLFTASASQHGAIAAIASSTGIRITPIGTVEAGSGVSLRDAEGKAMALRDLGYTHF